MNASPRIALVTGAAQGIGRAIATRLAADGAVLALLDWDAAQLAATAAALGGAFSCRLDLTDRAELQAAVAQVTARFGRVDILVNNVGRSARELAAPYWETAASTNDMLVDVCLRTTLEACRLVVPGMRERGWGRIVSIASEAAFTGSLGGSAYAAAKAGVIGFTRSLAVELAASGVTVNAVAPGLTRTRALEQIPAEIVAKAVAQIPQGAIIEPAEIAHAVAFFASEGARPITGQTLLVNGGRWML